MTPSQVVRIIPCRSGRGKKVAAKAGTSIMVHTSENIQRGEGFKGFNPHTVSDIMRRIDPRVEFRAA